MTASRWQQVKSIFHRAVQLDPEELAAFLRENCGSDRELQQEVESLLASDHNGGSMLESPLTPPGAMAAAAPAHRPDPMLGRIVGNYLITGELARGGMGIVYRGRHVTLPREVVVKCIRPASEEAAGEMRARFRREALIQSQLDHPHIVRVHEFFEGDEEYFLVMEYVHGATLRSLLDDRRVLGVDEAIALAVQMLEGLDHAHNFHFVDESGNAGSGVIHRDVKPANILVDEHGNVKLTDFGIVKLSGNSQFTKTGSNPGTVDYMSPEQILNKQVDARSDLYSVGVTLYEMLSGAVPFRSSQDDSAYEVLKAHIETDTPPLRTLNPGVPLPLANAIARSLKRDPDQRWQTAAEFRDTLSLYQRDRMVIAPAKHPPKRRVSWLVAACLAALVLAAFAGILWLGLGGKALRTTQDKASIAVLPFTDMSPEKNQEYFSEGLAEEVLNGLASIPELRVAGRTSSFQIKGQMGDFLRIGQMLHVATILEGSVRRQGNRAKIAVRLISAADGYSLWSETFDRELNDIFAVEDEIGRAVTGALRVRLLDQKKTGPVAKTPSIEAWNAFLHGQHLLLGPRSRDALNEAVRYFEMAVKLDPGYATAWAGLGRARCNQAGWAYVREGEGYRESRAAVEHALLLNPNLAEAHAVLGEIRMVHDWNWVGADASFQQALALEPGNAIVIGGAGDMAWTLGRWDEAIALYRRAIEIDPLNSNLYFYIGNVFDYAGRPEEAKAAFMKSLELEPAMQFAHGFLCRALLSQSRFEDALSEAKKEKDPAIRLWALALSYRALGREKESNTNLTELIAKFPADDPYQIAGVFAFRGEKDKAFEWLERAYSAHDAGLSEIVGDPLLKSLTSDARYTALLKKIHL